MKTEAEVKAKLHELRAAQKRALDERMTWSIIDTRHRIDILEWVLSMRDELE